jgi:hypothetical protein
MAEQEFLNALGDLTGKVAIVTGYISHLNVFPSHSDGFYGRDSWPFVPVHRLI